MLQKMATYFLLIFAASFVAQSSCAQLQFVENKGQWDNNVKYRADLPGGKLFAGAKRQGKGYYGQRVYSLHSLDLPQKL